MRLKGNFFVFVRRTIQYAGARQPNLRTRSLMPQEAATLRLFQYPRAKDINNGHARIGNALLQALAKSSMAL